MADCDPIITRAKELEVQWHLQSGMWPIIAAALREAAEREKAEANKWRALYEHERKMIADRRRPSGCSCDIDDETEALRAVCNLHKDREEAAYQRGRESVLAQLREPSEALMLAARRGYHDYHDPGLRTAIRAIADHLASANPAPPEEGA